MDDQQHHQTSSDHHGVHLCHKCGWPYPNPHPSAKHRRAHKRICGVIEGYKLGDFEGSAHSNGSDDEHLSDEDHKIPSPKVLGASSHEKDSGGSGEIPKLPNRSEDEVFSGATAENFLDARIGGRAQGRVEDAGELATNVDKNLKTESNMAQSIERGSVAVTVKPRGSSPENIQTQHLVTPETASDRSGFAPELLGSSASFNSNPTVSSVSDGRTEDSAVMIDGDSNASVDDLHPIRTKTPEDVSRKNEKMNVVDDVVDGSLKLAEQQTNLEGQKETYFDSNTIDDVVDGSLKLAEQRTYLKGQKETYFDSNLQDVKTPPARLDGETAEAISEPDKSLKDNSDCSPPKPEYGILQLQEEDSLKNSKVDVFQEVETVEHVDALAGTAEKTVEITGLNSLDSDDLVEKREEVDANVHMLSVADDIHVVENPVIMLKDFKDHKVMKLDQSASLECEQAKEKGDDTQGPVLEKSCQSNQNEGIVLSSSDKHVLEDSVQLDRGTGTRIVKDVLVEGDVDLSLFKIEKTENQRSNVIGASAGVVMPYIDKVLSVFSAKGQESCDICSDTLQGNVSGNSDNAVSDADLAIASGSAGTVLEACLVGESGYKEAEKSDLSGDYNSKGAREVGHAKNPVTAAEAAGGGFQFQVNPTSYLQEGDDAGNFVDISGNEDADVAARLLKNETGVDSENSLSKESRSERLVVAPGTARNISEVQTRPETILREGDTAGDLDEVETKKDEITDDHAQNPVTAAEAAGGGFQFQVNPTSCLQEGDDAGNFVDISGNEDADVAARLLKNETGVDSENSPSKESRSKRLVVAPGTARNISEVQTHSETILWERDTTGDLDAVETKKDEITDDHAKNPVTAAEAAGGGFQFQVNPTSCLQEGDDAGNFVDISGNEDADVAARLLKNETGVDSENSPSKESRSKRLVVAPGTARNISEVQTHSETILREGDTAGDLDEVETKKDEITDDPRDAAARDAKDETGVGNDNSPLKERYPVVTSESAKNLLELEINSETNLQEGDTARNFQKVETKKDNIIFAACDVKHETGVDTDNGPSRESCLEHPVGILESAKNLAEVEINVITNLQGDVAGTLGKVETKQNKISGDAYDGTVCHAKDELGVDDIIDPTKEIITEHLVVTLESSKNSSNLEANSKTNLREEETSGNCEKVEAEKIDITGRACDAKRGTGVDNNNSLSKEICSEHPIVASESAKSFAEVEIDLETDLQKEDTSGNFNKVDTKKEDITGGACGAKGEIGVDNNNSPSGETCSEHTVVAPESAKTIFGVENILETDLRGGDSAGITGDSSEVAPPHAKDETGVDNDNNPLKESFSEPQLVVAPESAKTEAAIDPETKVREGDTAGNFKNAETEKDVITGGSCDAASRDVNDETGDDNNNSLSKERFSEPNLVVTPESAKTESEINPETKLQGGDTAYTAGNFKKVESKTGKVTRGSCDAVAADVKDESGVVNSNSPLKESCSEHPVVAPKSSKILSEVKINLVSDLQEEDVAGTFGKVESTKDNSTGDTCDGTIGHMKYEVGADNSVGLIKNPIVTLESARNLSDLKVVSETNLWEDDTAGKFEKVETKMDHIIADSCDAAAGHVEAEIGGVNSVVPAKESGPENAAVTCESTNQFSELDVNPAANSQEGDDAFDSEKGRMEKFVKHEAESKEGFVKENLPVQIKTTTESASHPREFQTVADDVVSGSTVLSQETGDKALDSSRLDDDVVKEIQIEAVDDKLDENDKVKVQHVVNATTSNCEREVRPSPHTVDDHVKEAALSPVVKDTSAREFDAASGLDRQQFGDSSSQSDSLENNWGSVSVLSIQSDAQPVVDADTVPKESKSATERKYPDKSDMFEPPSFMTLVELGEENDQKATAAETQTKSSTMQAGWFPLITHVVNESQGRKKNEEIIAKVTNWSTSKPHTPLKNFLGEASLDTRAKSPKRKDLAPSPQKDDKAASTVNSIPETESSLDQAANREIKNEWNSPARYPTEIKREKRKPKGRPYWAQFMCCSSVH